MSPKAARKMQAVRIILPPVLSVVLFCAAIFGVFLPALESSVMAKKREMIRELTQTAWNTLDLYYHMELSGELTREQAQVSAIRFLRSQRYGPEHKDYFWIMNRQSRLIMHPYLTHLENRVASDGDNVEISRVLTSTQDLVRNQGSGYVDYVWQWKDSPRRLGKKQSFVKGFDPWNWIVGTGVYLDDVENELTALRGKLLKISALIFGVVSVLVIYIIRRGLAHEAQRQQADEKIRESEENFRSVMMAVPDPVVVYDIDGRVTYINKAFTRVFGWELSELRGRRIDFVPEACKAETRTMVANTIKFGYCASIETQRLKKSGDRIDVSISAALYRDDAGQTLGIVVNLHDISAFNRTKQELEKHQTNA